MNRCFFTNAFMGLCAGRNNGEYEGRKHEGFRKACLSFLKVQIEIQRPRLGSYAWFTFTALTCMYVSQSGRLEGSSHAFKL